MKRGERRGRRGRRALLAGIALVVLSGACASVEERAREIRTERIGEVSFVPTTDMRRDGFRVDYGEDGSLKRVGVFWEDRHVEGLDAALVTWDGRLIAPIACDDELSGCLVSHFARQYWKHFSFETDVPRSALCSVAVIWSGERREVAIPEK